MNSVGGRIWCGYLCPQTVWTDLFYAVERLIEGDRRERMKKDADGLDAQARRGDRAQAFDLADDRLVDRRRLGALFRRRADAGEAAATFQAPMIAYIWIGILTATTYVLAGYMREQVCIYMCPWPRIQAALTDEWALNVTYRYDRGEAAHLAEEGRRSCAPRARRSATASTAINASRCARPASISATAPQLDCIQCGLCIDACDTVMDKIGRPTRLIGYDNDINIKRRMDGKPEIYRIVRPRTVVYCGLIAVVGAIMLYTLLTRTLLDVNVLHDRNPVAVKLSDGSIRNAYTMRLLNKRGFDRVIAIDVDGPVERDRARRRRGLGDAGPADDRARPRRDHGAARAGDGAGGKQYREIDAGAVPHHRYRPRRDRGHHRQFHGAVRRETIDAQSDPGHRGR